MENTQTAYIDGIPEELEEDKIDLIEIKDIEEFNAALQQFDGYMKEPGFFVDN